MSKNTNVLTIRVPRDLKERIEKMAEQQGVSMNQFAVYAFTREITALESAAYFKDQYTGKTESEIFADFDAVMGRMPKRRGPEWDRMDGDGV